MAAANGKTGVAALIKRDCLLTAYLLLIFLHNFALSQFQSYGSGRANRIGLLKFIAPKIYC
ncbi:hypothetical protein N7488_004652 [Penicillium malachiteum]|nr:hypothetical protein N7488_004652 [Penicillium malachiteum]